MGILDPYAALELDTACAFCLLREDPKNAKPDDEPEWGELEPGQPLSRPKVVVKHFSAEDMARGAHLGAMR